MDFSRHMSVLNVLFKDAFDQMNISPKNIEPCMTPLIGFTGRSVSSITNIMLPVSINGVIWNLEFLIVDAPSSYNGIMGRSTLNKLKASIWTYSATVIRSGTRTYFLAGDMHIGREFL